MNKTRLIEAKRLEQLWAGEFGNAYVERNRLAGCKRKRFWARLVKDVKPQSVLEVGCNVGSNLQWLAQVLPTHGVYGVDINDKALTEIKRDLPAINVLWAPARKLPFQDQFFDLVFTMGVLIHQPESTLPVVMNEMVRCSKRWILCGEYYAPETLEVPYRHQKGALFKRNYGGLFSEMFPDLHLVKKGFLDQRQGWDDVTYWLFCKGD